MSVQECTANYQVHRKQLKVIDRRTSSSFLFNFVIDRMMHYVGFFERPQDVGVELDTNEEFCDYDDFVSLSECTQQRNVHHGLVTPVAQFGVQGYLQNIVLLKEWVQYLRNLFLHELQTKTY